MTTQTETSPGGTPTDDNTTKDGPLRGYRVLELCSTIAGPACTRLLADFGAEVIKVEPPEGDAVRKYGVPDEGVELYAASILRNKYAVSIDFKTDAGCDLVRRLARQCDVVVENFRPGTLERLGLGYDRLSEGNPGLVLVRISGYGQTGPYSAKAGYGAICEAFAGVRELIGEPDRPPVRVAVPVTAISPQPMPRSARSWHCWSAVAPAADRSWTRRCTKRRSR